MLAAYGSEAHAKLGLRLKTNLRRQTFIAYLSLFLALNVVPIFVIGALTSFPVQFSFIDDFSISLEDAIKVTGLSAFFGVGMALYYSVLVPAKIDFRNDDDRLHLGLLVIVFFAACFWIVLPDYDELGTAQLFALRVLYITGAILLMQRVNAKNLLMMFLVCLFISLNGPRAYILGYAVFLGFLGLKDGYVKIVPVISLRNLIGLAAVFVLGLVLAVFRAGDSVAELQFDVLSVFFHLRTLFLSSYLALQNGIPTEVVASDTIPLGGIALKSVGVFTLSLPDFFTRQLANSSDYLGVGIGAAATSLFLGVRDAASVVLIVVGLIITKAMTLIIPSRILMFFLVANIFIYVRKGIFDLVFDLALIFVLSAIFQIAAHVSRQSK